MWDVSLLYRNRRSRRSQAAGPAEVAASLGRGSLCMGRESLGKSDLTYEHSPNYYALVQ